jgi:hypothetical protein
MAGDWIKVRVDLLEDANVLHLSDILGTDDPTTVGLLVRFWAWIDRQTADGTGIRVSRQRLDKLVGREGFTSGLLTIGWLEGEDGNFQVPNFERHNGNSAKARALESEAKRFRRASDKLSDKTSDKKGENVRPEKRREEKNKSLTEIYKATDPNLIETIVSAYPRREAKAECLAIVAKHIENGEDPESILAGTRAIASAIQQLPSGHLNKFVIGAARFFREMRWADDPATILRQNAPGTTSDGQKLELGGRRPSSVTKIPLNPQK